MCSEKETYIGEKIEDNTKGFKATINQYISDLRQGFQRASCIGLWY